jgi:hypothetical protein
LVGIGGDVGDKFLGCKSEKSLQTDVVGLQATEGEVVVGYCVGNLGWRVSEPSTT